MLRSMTGFGRCVVEDHDWTQTWEIKSVNSRFLDIKWRLPLSIRSQEQKFEKVIRQHASRGRIEINLNLSQVEVNIHKYSFNFEQAQIMLNAVNELALQRGEPFIPDYSKLLSISSLWEKHNDDIDEQLATRLEEGLIAALDDWNESREAEGAVLFSDLSKRISQLKEWLLYIEAYAPQVKEERLTVIRERIAEVLMQSGAELEESRFLQELVIHTDKLDISEEITRLHSHLNRLSEILMKSRDTGRRLEFTLQECFREISTCGNKIQDIPISNVVVDFKTELEKCREQVQNLE